MRAGDRIQRLCLTAFLALCMGPGVGAEERVELDVRGRPQTLHLYGPRSGPPIVVVSGDGGWVRLAVDAAEQLGTLGWFAVGVDAKHYLSSFTEGRRTLAVEDVPGDFGRFVDFALQGRQARLPIAGVSEGAGLAVLAAADASLQPRLLGVLGLGLPDETELGWRFRDSLIYLTHGTPNEPSFHSGDYVAKLGPVPLAAIHSSRDEFVPLSEVQKLMALPGGPRRLWVIDAADHRFSDRRTELWARLVEALDWLRAER